MQIINTPQQMNQVAQQIRAQGLKLGLVPTMGNLHAGHLSLVSQIKPLVDRVVVSIFVNPTQFGPNEDYDLYPRTFEADCEKLASVGVDFVFAPTASDMYPGDASTQAYVKVPGISDILCGAFRPGHFQGVATVVCKLFQITQPEVAIFGLKDYQQLQVIRRMAADLSIPVKILGAPIVREANGLAMSSRNQYLDETQKLCASTLYRELNTLVEQAKTQNDYQALIQASLSRLQAAGFKPDYLAIRRQSDLQEPGPEDKQLVALAAAYLGPTRLIDNLIFEK